MKLNSQLLTNATFMLDFLIVLNNKEFYPKAHLDSSTSSIRMCEPFNDSSSPM